MLQHLNHLGCHLLKFFKLCNTFLEVPNCWEESRLINRRINLLNKLVNKTDVSMLLVSIRTFTSVLVLIEVWTGTFPRGGANSGSLH